MDFFVELPDGRIAILECKTTNYNSKEKWSDGAVPVNYEWQCRHYLAVMNLSCAYIACLYGNNENEFVYRRIDRDEAIEQDMIEMEDHFWNEYVLGRIEPPYTESGELVLESIRRHYGELDPTADAVILPISMAAKLERYGCGANQVYDDVGRCDESHDFGWLVQRAPTWPDSSRKTELPKLVHDRLQRSGQYPAGGSVSAV